MTARKYTFFKIGFHGDRHLISVVSEYLSTATHFVETGTNVASTLQFVGATFPNTECISCEPDAGAYGEACNNTSHLSNTTILNTDSVNFMETIRDQLPANGEGLVCWLDAHGHGFDWPLCEEVRFFTEHFPQAAIFIDDFKVPGRDDFGFDQYNEQECSFEFIRDSIDGDNLQIVYPTYTEHTSDHHPLRGWCLIRQATPSPGKMESTLSQAFEIQSNLTV